MKSINSLIFGALVCLPALSVAGSIRCGDRIIMEGSTRAEVAALCGQPTQIDHRTVYNNTGVVVRGSTTVTGDSGVSVDLEVWTYNFGPDRLMQRVRFDANGTVVSIESLGYGFTQP